LAILLSSCSKKNENPEPPHVKTQLTADMFSALSTNNYPLAKQKVERLISIEPNAAFLGTLASTINDNSAIIQAQTEINSGNIKAAISGINNIMQKNGQSIPLINALKELEMLQQIELYITDISKADNSRDIAISAAKLNKEIINNNITQSSLSQFTEKSILAAKKIRQAEINLGIEDLIADIDIAYATGNENIDTLTAILGAASPDNQFIKSYKASLSNNWKEIPCQSLNYNNSNEFIYLRQALSTKNNQKRNEILNSLLTYSPSNFTSLLIKASILKFFNRIDEANALLKELSTQLATSKTQENSWNTFLPKNQKSFLDISPLALYPFYVYFYIN